MFPRSSGKRDVLQLGLSAGTANPLFKLLTRKPLSPYCLLEYKGQNANGLNTVLMNQPPFGFPWANPEEPSLLFCHLMEGRSRLDGACLHGFQPFCFLRPGFECDRIDFAKCRVTRSLLNNCANCTLHFNVPRIIPHIFNF